MYTKDRNIAGTDKKVTNWANWRIKPWRIRQILLYMRIQNFASTTIHWTVLNYTCISKASMYYRDISTILSSIESY